MVSPTNTGSLPSLVSLPVGVLIPTIFFFFFAFFFFYNLYSSHDVCSRAAKWISAGPSRCWKHLESRPSVDPCLARRSTTTPLASKRDMVLMGLLTRHAGFSRACWHVFCACFWPQPVSGASVQGVMCKTQD